MWFSGDPKSSSGSSEHNRFGDSCFFHIIPNNMSFKSLLDIAFNQTNKINLVEQTSLILYSQHFSSWHAMLPPGDLLCQRILHGSCARSNDVPLYVLTMHGHRPCKWRLIFRYAVNHKISRLLAVSNSLFPFDGTLLNWPFLAFWFF